MVSCQGSSRNARRWRPHETEEIQWSSTNRSGLWNCPAALRPVPSWRPSPASSSLWQPSSASHTCGHTRRAIGTGVVVIETNLGYQGGQAAGTGMVLTSSGEVLTNNHVIRGATDIKVRVPSTGRSYAAKVVGYYGLG